MKEEYDLILRAIISILPYFLLSTILLPLTVYGSKLILFFYEPTVINNTIIIQGIQFEFIEACVASLAYWFLWILIWWTRGITLKTRLKLAGIGFILIYAMNILRIFILTIIAVSYSFELFTRLHLFIWNFISGIFIAFVWIYLVKRYKIKSIPIYDDIKHFWKKSYFRKN